MKGSELSAADETSRSRLREMVDKGQLMLFNPRVADAPVWRARLDHHGRMLEAATPTLLLSLVRVERARLAAELAELTGERA